MKLGEYSSITPTFNTGTLQGFVHSPLLYMNKVYSMTQATSSFVDDASVVGLIDRNHKSNTGISLNFIKFLG